LRKFSNSDLKLSFDLVTAVARNSGLFRRLFDGPSRVLLAVSVENQPPLKLRKETSQRRYFIDDYYSVS